MQQVELTYNDVHQLVESQPLPPELVSLPWYAIARGGLPLATMLGVRYNKRFGVIDPQEGFLSPFHWIAFATDPLVLIDDVIGSGGTMRLVNAQLARFRFAGPVHRLLLVKTPDDAGAFHFLDGTDTFYHLPWEPNGE